MSRERNHHFVPEFHLRMFAGGWRRELSVYDKRWGKLGVRAAASSARLRGYYLVPGSTPDERLLLEREFARLENLIAPLVRRLDAASVGAVPLGEVERHNLAACAAILHVCGPAYRDDSLKRAQELAADPDAIGLGDSVDFRKAVRRLGFRGTEDELERRRVRALEGLRSGAIRISVPPAVSLGGLRPAIGRGVPLLLAREWELLGASSWPGFVIGDQPVALFSHGSLAPSIGFGSPDVQVFMPLSPRTLLLISDRPRSGHPLTVISERTPAIGEPWWATANKIAWLTSQRYVWGRRGDLQTTELLLPEDDRRRDLRILDDVQEARRRQVAAERRRARRDRE